ncbi:VanZ family protein [Pelagibacteraceae bacterium]|nr:VanZ family protein [Pelagibacteraceae bacterium]
MKNNIFILLKCSYYFSLVILLIFYLFPGSLIGYFLYENLAQQPNLISNPIGTSINHLISFVLLGFLAFIVRIKEKKFVNSFQFLLIISISLEILHHFIPNRAFEYYDLFANCIGVILTYLIIQLILKVRTR